MHNKPHTEEAKKKMSLRLKGKKLSEEHRKNVAKSTLRKWQDINYKKRVGLAISKGKKGTKISEQGRENIRQSKIGTFSGSKHWNWRGGITPIRETIRKMFEYRQWRSDVYQRDNFTCQVCFERGGALEADHYPKMFSQILDTNKIKTLDEARICSELWDLNNGRTLCKACHKKTYTGVPKKPWIKKV